ncbi:PREDICTED: dehydrodolichyl diphosphate syntase complex subunit NUS1 isoform X1 [Vollenhovia emeryi]|uniref:dehydrodolichyl diphosphate syntase complex subunit NUS1 isoform X1 n=1 Tax=Vollenhovia emeryi TaxID=411798 RepID=UPI0005F55C9A|nr:PREDICTED: dehydrodolichyl diphosphate syntase complex subunit NUS1 isoform X1 [Vollenhovia emeryi]
MPHTLLCCIDTQSHASSMSAFLHMMLVLAHLLHSLYIAIRYACDAAYGRCAEYWRAGTTAELIRTLTKMKRIPRHLVIVSGLGDESVLDCVRIITWSTILDIPYISFFDRNGFFKKNEINLKEELAKQRPDLVECIIWNSPEKAPSQNGIIGNKSKICVSLLSNTDGKGKMGTLAQSLAKAISTGNLDPEDITDLLISEKLQIKGMPDPDLALIYGNTYSTHGVLPWHTRTTEFLMLPLYVNISVKDFTYLLERYSKCKQRHGK